MEKKLAILTLVILGCVAPFLPWTADPVLPAGPQVGPNVLIFLTDDQRDDMTKMAKTTSWLADGGVTYSNAYVTTPLCCPSRASVLSGQYAHNHKVIDLIDAEKRFHADNSVARYLHDAGYSTALFGKYLNGSRSRPPYFDQWATFPNSTRSVYEGEEIWNVQGEPTVVTDSPTDYIGNQAVRFIRRNSTKSWFLLLAPPNPHVPFTPEAGYASAEAGSWTCNAAVLETDKSDKPPYVQEASKGCTYGQQTRRAQIRNMLSVDDMVDQVMSEVPSNTLVFFLSDNGLMWGEHGLQGKRVPYLQAVEIPLFAWWPGRLTPGSTDDRLAANIDIAPTILDAAGISPEHTVDGRSLLDGASRERLLLEGWSNPDMPPTFASTITTREQFIEYYDGSGATSYGEYYDLESDPWQLTNLLGDAVAANDPDLGALSRRLERDRACAGTTCP